MFPFSREVGKLGNLQRRLEVYRLAFGQPRQEDLVELLARVVGDGGPDGGEVRISLEPVGVPPHDVIWVPAIEAGGRAEPIS